MDVDKGKGRGTPVRDHVDASYDVWNNEVQLDVDFKPKEGAPKKEPSDTAKQLQETLKAASESPLVAEMLSEAVAAIGPQDSASKTAIAEAKTGRSHAELNESLYLKLNEKSVSQPLTPGEHKNDDGSTITVGASGHIETFTTAPTPEFPQGLKYSNIRHDENGEMVSCDTPWQMTFTRTSPTDDKGFATWTSTHNGRPVLYPGAASSTWKGEFSVDNSGFHSFVLTGQNKNTLFTRTGDGSLVSTRALEQNGQYTGLETVAALSDKSRVVHKTNFRNGQVVPENEVTVFDATTKTARTVDISPLTGAYKIAEKHKLRPVDPEMQRMAENARKRMELSRDPVGDITRTLESIDPLRCANVRREGASYKIDAHFDSATSVDPIRLDKRLITPGRTQIGTDISFTLTPQNGGFELSEMSGFRSSITGPFGGVHDTYPTSLFLGRDRHGPYLDVHGYAELRRRDIHKSLRLRQGNLPPGNPMSDMMGDPEALKNLSNAMRLFQGNSDVDQISINRVARGYYDISAVSGTQTHIHIDEEVGKHGMLNIDSIDIERGLSARLSKDPNGVRMEYIRGMTLNASSPIVGDIKIQPLKVGMSKGADGKPVLELEIQSPDIKGLKLGVEVPQSPAAGDKKVNAATVKFQIPMDSLR